MTPMTKWIVSLTAALVLGLAGAMIGGGRAHAAAIAPDGLRAAAHELAAVEKVQFMWGGRRYCWYDAGWRGPGWYWCGHHWRRGIGWGGPVGWHGWRRPGVHPPTANRPGIRPPIGHVPGNRPGHRPGHRPGSGRPGGKRSSGSGNR
jgi:hypothetical protein